MESGLIEAFKRYSKLVLATLRNNRVSDERLGATVIPTSSRSRRIEFLPKVVERLEREEDFCQLMIETRAAFPDQYYTHDDYWTREAVQNFFRRSGFYLDVFEGRDIDIEGVFKRYVTAFQDDKTEVTRLTLLEGVEFASPIACMNFNTFQIRRFSAEELANIVGNQINQIFYPRAVIDVKWLQAYWFLSTMRTQPRSHPIRTLDTLDWSRVGQIEPYYQSGAEELRFGSPNQILALFAWEDWDEIEFGRGPCDLPLVLRFDDDLLSSPAATPKLSHLQTGIWVNPDTEEEIEYPAIWLHLDAEGTDQFNTFVQRIEHLFGSLQPQALGWEFLEIGLAYYMKALQSTGLEQLLWHMTALEALLGERGEGITERLARRISMILGTTKTEREKIRKQFKELYGFRSDLVHGNKFGKKVLVAHLTTARNFARQTLLWFLHYLCTAEPKTKQSRGSASVPSRDVLLTCLELDENSRQSLRGLMDILPQGFPAVHGWIN